ncbi:MAG: ABC transporter ATP-binding protein [Clostridia bacterium]|nr:ABC transporter ATP-binding protein [Clostridia bacterium]
MKKNKLKGIWSTVKKVVAYAKPHKAYFFLSLLSAFIAIGLNMFVPVILGWAIDCVVGVGAVNFAKLSRVLIGIGVVAVVSATFEWFEVYFENILTNRTAQSMRNKCFEKINQVPLKYIDNKPHGDIMSTIINDIENVTDGFLSGFKSLLSGVVTIASVIIFMVSINVPMALIVMVLAPLSLLISVYITKKSKKLYAERVNKLGEISAYSEEMIGNIKVIKAFNNENKNIDDFQKINKELYKSAEKASFYASLAWPCTKLVNGVLYAIVAVSGAFVCIHGHISIGEVSTFLSYVEHYTSPFNEISSIVADIQIAVASANRVFELLEENDEISDEDCPNIVNCNGEVKLKDVCFSYTPQSKLIENLNVTTTKGKTIAIVGPTGCGKSTIINLLMRFYDINSGKIIVSNRDIQKVTRKSLRNCYGMVLQESWLYNASIRDNIAYGKPDATMEEIIEASKLANAHTFIEKLPEGYDTIITESADNVSAGQKQLICIARIMLTKPPMLILDEATSNIDTRTEMNIQQAFDYIMDGRTCFIVAHRLSTIINADEILVMNKGKIIEQGTHQELLAKNGFYTQLFNSQFGG